MAEIASVAAIIALSLSGELNLLWEEAQELGGKDRAKDLNDRALQLAIRICQASRVVHIRAWVEGMPSEAAPKVVAVLTLLAEWIDTVPDGDRYAANVRTRIRSLNNLRDGKDPELPDDAFPEEKEAILEAARRMEALPKWHSNCEQVLNSLRV